MSIGNMLPVFTTWLLFKVGSCMVDDSICNQPDLWCANAKNARLCGVTEYCRRSSMTTSNQPMNVTVYMESMCPDTQHFFMSQLYPTFKKLYSSGIFNLRLVPFGNAKEYKSGNKWAFECQHGPNECQGNLIQTCAMHYLDDISISMPFVYCVEIKGAIKATAEKCASELGIDYAPIDECVNTEIGNNLEHQMAVETNNLKPRHTYVPWITINGIHTEKMQQALQKDMFQYLCDKYKGRKPTACVTA